MKIIRFIKLIRILVEAVIKLGYLAVGIGAIFALTYLFGHRLLEGLPGGDVRYALHNINWYNRWFPRIPLWYPLQGAGVSLTQSYPLGATYLVILLHRATHIPIIGVYRLVGFGAIFLTALGIYLFCWTRLKNQTIGLIAGAFFLLAPHVWYWLMIPGVFAQSVSLCTIPFAFLFFDLFLEKFFLGRNKVVKIITFILASFSYGFSVFSHIMLGVTLGIALPLYSAVRSLTFKSKRSFSSFVKGIGVSFLTMGAGLALFAFWFLPFLYYNHLANREGLLNLPLDQLVGQVADPYTFFTVFIPFFIAILAAAGFLVAIFRRNLAAAVSLVGFFFVFYSASPPHLPGSWLRKLRFLFSSTFDRSITVSLVLLPVAAAYAIGGAVDWVGEVFFKIWEKFLPFAKPFFFFAKVVLVAGVTLFLAGWMIFNFEDRAPWGYGPLKWTKEELKVKEGFSDFYFKEGYALVWLKDRFQQKKLHLSLAEPLAGLAPSLLEKMELSPLDRIDLSVYLGGVLQNWGDYTDTSTLNLYMYNGSLLHAMWGHQQAVFYGPKNEFHRPTAVSELSRWFGFKYVVINKDGDETTHFSPQDWSPILAGGGAIWEFKDPKGIVTISDRPAFLVVGKHLSAYDHVFRVTILGALPYDKGFVVEGKEAIDSYSLKELKKFKGIILHGYHYSSRKKAFKLLDAYLKAGGNVFIDTGWQFESPDWNLKIVPDFFPVEELEWGDLGKDVHFNLGDLKVRNLDLSKFSPLDWYGKPWGLSLPTSLKDWATPFLLVGDQPVIVGGRYGEGRIVWSGMNIFSHIRNYQDNEEEVKFLKAIFDWLLPSGEGAVPKLSVRRDYPDEVEIEVKGGVSEDSFLLWKEAYSPQWKVVLEDGKRQRLPFYRAGPGLLLIDLPEVAKPFKVRLRYQLGWPGILGKMTTVSTVLFFVFLLIDRIFWAGKIEKMVTDKFLSFRIVRFLKNPIEPIRFFISGGEEDEEV